MRGKITAIILAAGQGKRMNSTVAKQFLELQNKPILYYSLSTFQKSTVDQIILVTGRDQIDYCKELVTQHRFDKVSEIIQGGKERYDSVYCALQSIKDCSYVLIHDGARPFISLRLIEESIIKVRELNACILGVPVKDTIKVVDDNGEIVSTPDRNTLWTAQTPQCFMYCQIRQAYEKLMETKNLENLSITDDAMVYETFLRKSVHMITGDYSNIKITTPEDLIMAEKILEDTFLR